MNKKISKQNAAIKKRWCILRKPKKIRTMLSFFKPSGRSFVSAVKRQPLHDRRACVPLKEFLR